MTRVKLKRGIASLLSTLIILVSLMNSAPTYAEAKEIFKVRSPLLKTQSNSLDKDKAVIVKDNVIEEENKKKSDSDIKVNKTSEQTEGDGLLLFKVDTKLRA